MLRLTKIELKTFQYSTVCYICGKGFPKSLLTVKKYRNVRDQCHFTGKYRAAAHSIWNLRLNTSN